MSVETIKEKIVKVGGVKQVKGVFGRYDFVAIVEVGAPQELSTVVSVLTETS